MMVWVHNASQVVDDKSQWPTILAVCLILTTFMVIIVGLRGYVRGVMLKAVGADDLVILFSMICSIIYSGLAIGQTKWGLGLDLPDRPKVDLNNYAVINFAGRPFYMAGITCFKVALCISYLRILSGSKRVYRQLVWFIMISCTLLHLAGTLVLIFQCHPVKKSWRPLTHGKCLPNDKTFYALSAVTIFYDCVIFLLPIPILMQLHINTRRKAALIGVFILGLFTTVCSIMRMVQIITIAKTGNSTMLVLWGTIEMNVGIALTCIPTLTPLFTYFREKTTGAYSKKRTYENTNSTSHGHSLSILRSMPKSQSRITDTSSEPWVDHDDNDDSSSQQAIVGDEDESAGRYDNVIRATTRVEVQITEGVKDGDRLYIQPRWAGV